MVLGLKRARRNPSPRANREPGHRRMIHACSWSESLNLGSESESARNRLKLWVSDADKLDGELRAESKLMDIRKTTRNSGSGSPLEGVQKTSSVQNERGMPHAESLADTKEVTREVMHKLEDAREQGDPIKRDRMDLSEQLRHRADMDLKGESVRASLVSELREAYQTGSLASSERVESAARRLLGER